jgi:hypothetical protein
MDALLYIEAAKTCLADEVEEAMLNRINIVAQNGNDGLHYDNLGDFDVEYEKII